MKPHVGLWESQEEEIYKFLNFVKNNNNNNKVQPSSDHSCQIVGKGGGGEKYIVLWISPEL